MKYESILSQRPIYLPHYMFFIVITFHFMQEFMILEKK